MSSEKKDYLKDRVSRGCTPMHIVPAETTDDINNMNGRMIDVHAIPDQEPDWDGMRNNDIIRIAQRILTLEKKVGELGYNPNATTFEAVPKTANNPTYDTSATKDRFLVIGEGGAITNKHVGGDNAGDKALHFIKEGKTHAEMLSWLDRAIYEMSVRVGAKKPDPEMPGINGDVFNGTPAEVTNIDGVGISQTFNSPRTFNVNDTVVEAVAKLELYVNQLQKEKIPSHSANSFNDPANWATGKTHADKFWGSQYTWEQIQRLIENQTPDNKFVADYTAFLAEEKLIDPTDLKDYKVWSQAKTAFAMNTVWKKTREALVRISELIEKMGSGTCDDSGTGGGSTMSNPPAFVDLEWVSASNAETTNTGTNVIVVHKELTLPAGKKWRWVRVVLAVNIMGTSTFNGFNRVDINGVQQTGFVMTSSNHQCAIVGNTSVTFIAEGVPSVDSSNIIIDVYSSNKQVTPISQSAYVVGVAITPPPDYAGLVYNLGWHPASTVLNANTSGTDTLRAESSFVLPAGREWKGIYIYWASKRSGSSIPLTMGHVGEVVGTDPEVDITGNTSHNLGFTTSTNETEDIHTLFISPASTRNNVTIKLYLTGSTDLGRSCYALAMSADITPASGGGGGGGSTGLPVLTPPAVASPALGVGDASYQPGAYVPAWQSRPNLPYGGVARLASNRPATNGGCYQAAQGVLKLYMILADGTPCMVGYNAYGELGVGYHTASHSNFMKPVVIGANIGTNKVVQITTGGYYSTHLLLDNGDVYFAGYNGTGVSGDGTVAPTKRFKKVPGLSNIRALYPAAQYDSGNHEIMYCIDRSNNVWAAGYNGAANIIYPGRAAGNVTSFYQLPHQYECIVSAGCSWNPSMGLFQGRVYTWGYLGLGDGNGGTNSSGVWPTARVEIPRSVFGNNDVVQILIGGNADGGYCMYALTDAGTVYSMGGGHGVTMSPSLGTGITTGATQATFTLMSGLTGVVQITANRSNSYNNFYALKSDGTVWGCGYNQYGEIDRSADVWVSTCRQVPGVSNVVKVLAWGYGTVSGMMALTSTGSVIMRGRNDSGAYLGNAEDAHSNGVGVPDDGNVIAIESGAVDIQAYGNIYVGSSGYTTFVVLMSDGSIYHWGLSQGYAQIDASNVNIEVPTRRIVT